jgi:hypothetical protein
VRARGHARAGKRDARVHAHTRRALFSLRRRPMVLYRRHGVRQRRAANHCNEKPRRTPRRGPPRPSWQKHVSIRRPITRLLWLLFSSRAATTKQSARSGNAPMRVASRISKFAVSPRNLLDAASVSRRRIRHADL